MIERENELVYTAQEFLNDLPVLIQKIREEGQKIYLPLNPSISIPYGGFDGVYGIPAGGLILAVCLHYQLGLPLLMAPTERSLVVDDIADKGKSLSHYAQKGNFIVTLFYHRQSCVQPHIWLHEKFDKWIRFELWEGASSSKSLTGGIGPCAGVTNLSKQA